MTSSSNTGYFSSSDDEAEDDYRGKNGLMFLVDFREEMFTGESGTSHFRSCMDTCKNVMLQIARSGKNDLIGVSLIGTKKGTSDNSLPLLANIQPLNSVSAQRIKDIDQIIVDLGDSLKQKHGQIDKSDAFNLVKILNSCLKLFLECKSKIYNKTVVLLTCDDDPFGSDIQLAHLARKQAKKLSYAAIDLVVVGLGDNFDHNKFYNELISLARGEFTRDWAKTNRVKKLSDIHNHLLSLMSRLSRTHRELILHEKVSIPVSLYKLYKQPAVRLTRKVVTQNDDEEPKHESTANDSNVDVTGLSSNGRINTGKANKDLIPLVGGKVFNITRREIEEASPKTGVGLKLVGFVATQDVPEYLSITPPRVMLPNYFSTDGTKGFTCLLESCRDRQMSMICWYQYNKYSQPALVVCHPMTEQSDAEGNVCPDGFCIVSLPFDDNYADPDVKKLDAEPSDEQKNAAEVIVKKLSVSYSPVLFHDFEHKRLLAMIEALALDYDDMAEVEDDTIVDTTASDERISDFVEDFNDCSHLGQFDSVGASKRPAAASFRASKNPKLSSVEGMIEMIKEGKADALTVSQLKEALSSQAVYAPSTYKKPQLVQLALSKIK